MKIQKQVRYQIKSFTSEEIQLSQRVFGLVPQSVYFDFNVDLNIDTSKYKLIYIYGLSGEGKTIFKDELKKYLNMIHSDILDYDDNMFESVRLRTKKLSEIFDLEKDKEFVIRLFSTFGMFEMRNVFSKFTELSAGQQKRVQYMYLLYQAYKAEKERPGKTVILIDEFLTFVDSLSSKVFAQGLRKFMNKMLPNTLLFAFGCNDHICYTFEDLNIHLVNGKTYAIAEVTDVERED